MCWCVCGLGDDGGEEGGDATKKNNPSPKPTQPPATPDRIEGMPLTDVLLVNVKLLTLDELATITARGAEGRAALDASFAGRDRLVSSLARGSMV